jgi:hypothetical protein
MPIHVRIPPDPAANLTVAMAGKHPEELCRHGVHDSNLQLHRFPPNSRGGESAGEARIVRRGYTIRVTRSTQPKSSRREQQEFYRLCIGSDCTADKSI